MKPSPKAKRAFRVLTLVFLVAAALCALVAAFALIGSGNCDTGRGGCELMSSAKRWWIATGLCLALAGVSALSEWAAG